MSRKWYTLHTVSTQHLFLCFDFEKSLRLEHVCNVCARCELLLRLHKDSGCEAVLEPSGHFAQMLWTFYKGFIIFLIFLDAQILILLGFYTELLCFLDRLCGGHFLCFYRCQNYDDVLEEFICQSATKLVLVSLALFGPSGKVSWEPPLLG